jgi:hypothetical protein
MRVAEVQGCLLPRQALVAPGRELLREGNLTRVSPDGAEEAFYFFLFTDLCVMSSDEAAAGEAGRSAPPGSYVFRRTVRRSSRDGTTFDNAPVVTSILICPPL